MTDFEATLRLARVSNADLSRALGRLSTLREYASPSAQLTAEGSLHRSALPTLGELLARNVTRFEAAGDRSGPTDRCLPALAEVVQIARGLWEENFHDGDYSAWASFESGRLQFCFEQQAVSPDEGWRFMAAIVRQLELPVQLSREQDAATHRDGLRVQLIGSRGGLHCELATQDVLALRGYFEKFRALRDGESPVTSWAVSSSAGGDVEASYQALLRAALPAKQVSLTYEFEPPPLDLVPKFHELCVKPKDIFVIPVGSFAALPELRGNLQVELSKKGCQLSAVIEGELPDDHDDDQPVPFAPALRALRESFPKTLGIPLGK